MGDIVLEAVGVSKRFPDGRATRLVISRADLRVRAGEMVGLRGRSGCGKTTLLRLVCGLLEADAGSVSVVGDTMYPARKEARARLRRDRIGIVSQSYGLIEDESVIGNVLLPLMFRRPRPEPSEREAAFRRVAKAVGLGVRPEMIVSELSGGERQRLALARAMVTGPAVIVADEPTAALDSVSGSEITRLLRAVSDEGVGVLVATHDSQVAGACDRIYEFDGTELRQAESSDRGLPGQLPDLARASGVAAPSSSRAERGGAT